MILKIVQFYGAIFQRYLNYPPRWLVATNTGAWFYAISAWVWWKSFRAFNAALCRNRATLPGFRWEWR